MEVRKRRRLK